MTGEGQGVRDRLRQHLRNTHTPVRIHPDTSIHTPTRRRAHVCAHAHVCTKHAHPHLLPTGFTHLLTFSPPHTHLRTQVPPRHPSHSKTVPQFSLHKLSPPRRPTHVHVHRLTHTRMHVHLLTSHIWGKRKTQDPTCMHATSTEGRHPIRLLAHTCTFTHMSTSDYFLVFALKPSPGSKTQTLKMCLSLATLCHS